MCIMDLSGSGHGAVSRCREHGNKLSGSKREGEFSGQLSDYGFFEKFSVP
jgi:hypothetical protein